MRWLRDNWPPVVITLVMAMLVAVMIVVAVKDEQTWARFKLEHNCKVVGKEASQVVTGVTNGKPSTHVVPGKTTWLCDDGVKYTR